jgi:hypothetical protein
MSPPFINFRHKIGMTVKYDKEQLNTRTTLVCATENNEQKNLVFRDTFKLETGNKTSIDRRFETHLAHPLLQLR